MTGEDIQQQDLVISQLLTQDINNYTGLFQNVSVAIQIHNNNSGKYPMLSKRNKQIHSIRVSTETMEW